MSRYGPDAERLAVARLIAASEKGAENEESDILDTLRTISTRPDLLSQAAGYHAAHAQLAPDAAKPRHQRAASLLVAAGGSDDAAARDETDAVLARSRLIGNPARAT